jgi:hypothetical protein
MRTTSKRMWLGLASVVVLGGLVWMARPRPADTAVLGAYAQLDQSPVPVMVMGWVQPSAARVQVLPDGYVFTVHADQLGEVTVSGRRGAAPAGDGQLLWQVGDVRYSVATTADPALVQPRLVSLVDARRQLEGGGLDTPLLYLGYLPAFALFTVWAAGAMLLRPFWR